MKCHFKHPTENLPCKICNQEEYDRCIMENTQGKTPPHDLTELAKTLGIDIQKPTNKVTITGEMPDSLAEDVKLKEFLHGYTKKLGNQDYSGTYL